MMSGYVN
jgi:hypothetical protein